MSTNQPLSQWTPIPGNYEFNSSEQTLAIGGKLLTVRRDYSPELMEAQRTNWKEFVREQLANDLAKYIIDKHIEYTSMNDPLTGIQKVYARCYLAPDEQVRLLRIHSNDIRRP